MDRIDHVAVDGQTQPGLVVGRPHHRRPGNEQQRVARLPVSRHRRKCVAIWLLLPARMEQPRSTRAIASTVASAARMAQAERSPAIAIATRVRPRGKGQKKARSTQAAADEAGQKEQAGTPRASVPSRSVATLGRRAQASSAKPTTSRPGSVWPSCCRADSAGRTGEGNRAPPRRRRLREPLQAVGAAKLPDQRRQPPGPCRQHQQVGADPPARMAQRRERDSHQPMATRLISTGSKAAVLCT